MSVKPKQRLELDWSWLRASMEMTAQEKRVLSAVVAIALVGLAARHVWQKRANEPPSQPLPAEEYEP
jgi:hypothetical protein